MSSLGIHVVVQYLKQADQHLVLGDIAHARKAIDLALEWTKDVIKAEDAWENELDRPANNECRSCGDPVYCAGCFLDDERRD